MKLHIERWNMRNGTSMSYCGRSEQSIVQINQMDVGLFPHPATCLKCLRAYLIQYDRAEDYRDIATQIRQQR